MNVSTLNGLTVKAPSLKVLTLLPKDVRRKVKVRQLCAAENTNARILRIQPEIMEAVEWWYRIGLRGVTGLNPPERFVHAYNLGQKLA